jgi:polysaccharide biosynthesis/export protein
MSKSLLPTILIVLFVFPTVTAQGPTSKTPAEQLAAKPQIEAAITDSGETARQPVSAEAVAEAKRLYKIGTQYGRAGLYKQAAEVLERVVKLNPGHPDAFYSLGHAYFDLGEWNKSVENLQRAIELNPKDKEARERLNYASMMLQRTPVRNRERSATADETQTQATGSQTSLGASTSSSATKISNPELALTKLYRVGPGDVLDVRLRDDAAPKSSVFTITPAGYLEYPSIPQPLQVAGLTVEEVGTRITEELKRRSLLVGANVAVGVREYVSHTILVSGLVKEPGTKILRREAIPLYVVVADAQPLPEAARLNLVRNESAEVFDIDLAQPEDMNLMVHPGDVVTLLAGATQFFYISGEVKSPGEKTHRRGLTLTQAIIAAGGLTPKSKEARLARDDGKGFLTITKYKLKDIDAGKLPDPVIQPGDRITIVD